MGKLKWKYIISACFGLCSILYIYTWMNMRIDKLAVEHILSPRQTEGRMENEYYDSAYKIDGECPGESKYFGDPGDGGYRICTGGRYSFQNENCIVYDFGIGNMWKFDEDISQTFGCKVFAFDPTMKVDDHVHSKNIYFYSIGITGNKDDRRWPRMKTLRGIMEMLNHLDRDIDLIKMDVEFSEWEALSEAIKDGSLKRVKQLVFESHIDRIAKNFPEKTKVLNSLRDIHMKQWVYRNNVIESNYGISKYTGVRRVCCIEHSFLNGMISASTTHHDSDNHSKSQNKGPTPGEVTSSRMNQVDDSSPAAIENAYFNTTYKQDAKCDGQTKYFGNEGDGGYTLCLDNNFAFKKNDCIVYDFGINNMWDFDEDIVRQFNCKVYAFDPTMNMNDQTYSHNIFFYSIGVTGNKNDKRWQRMKSLKEIIEMLGHLDKDIDLLKMDIEFSEWHVIPTALKDGSFRRVKQLVFESHHHHTAESYLKGREILESLRSVPMRQWMYRNNVVPTNYFYSPYTGKKRVCCVEHSMINQHYFN